MPTYRSITISLVSQFDILNIPEYAPPKSPNDLFWASPALINPDHSLVSVYIPSYPSSQFWISYSISPPYPPKALYYFKLFLNGSCITSWGCSEADEYKGRTMFALFDTGETWMAQPILERRALFFGILEESDRKTHYNNFADVMEIKVYRSKGRKRIRPQVEEFYHPSSVRNKKKVHQDDEAGVNLINAGLLPPRHPQRYYKYALLDPLDQPFATFRYYYRSWAQLKILGIVPPDSNSSSSVHSRPSIDPATSSDRNPSIDNPQPHPPTITDQNSSTAKDHTGSPIATNHNKTTENPQIYAHTTTDDNPSTDNPQAKSAISPPSSAIFPSLAPLLPPKPPQKLPQSPPSHALHSALKPRSRSLPLSSSQSIFSSLIRRPPSPPKHSSTHHRNHSPTGVSLIYRSRSLGVLRDVVSSAMTRHARGFTEALANLESEEAWADFSAQREPEAVLSRVQDAEAKSTYPMISAKNADAGSETDQRTKGRWRRGKNRWERT